MTPRSGIVTMLAVLAGIIALYLVINMHHEPRHRTVVVTDSLPDASKDINFLSGNMAYIYDGSSSHHLLGDIQPTVMVGKSIALTSKSHYFCVSPIGPNGLDYVPILRPGQRCVVTNNNNYIVVTFSDRSGLNQLGETRFTKTDDVGLKRIIQDLYRKSQIKQPGPGRSYSI